MLWWMELQVLGLNLAPDIDFFFSSLKKFFGGLVVPYMTVIYEQNFGNGASTVDTALNLIRSYLNHPYTYMYIVWSLPSYSLMMILN